MATAADLPTIEAFWSALDSSKNPRALLEEIKASIRRAVSERNREAFSRDPRIAELFS